MISAAIDRRRRTRFRNEEKTGIAFLVVPFFILYVLTMIAPAVYALVLSLFVQRKSGLGFGGSVTEFAGIENYVNVFSSATFMSGLGRLGLYALVYVPLLIGLAILFALMLDATVAVAKRLFQLLLFLPHAVPGVIAALIWGYLYTPGISPIVSVLEDGGMAVNFLSVTMALPSVINIGIWEWTGYNVIIIFTALQAVPRDVLDAARVDGASEIRTALSIKLPMILPALSIVALFTVIGSLQLFTEPYILSKATSAVTNTWVPNMWAYDAAFSRYNLNQAAAASIIIAGAAGLLSWLVTRLSNRVQSK